MHVRVRLYMILGCVLLDVVVEVFVAYAAWYRIMWLGLHDDVASAIEVGSTVRLALLLLEHGVDRFDGRCPTTHAWKHHIWGYLKPSRFVDTRQTGVGQRW